MDTGAQYTSRPVVQDHLKVNPSIDGSAVVENNENKVETSSNVVIVMEQSLVLEISSLLIYFTSNRL
jgi:hypothetical protein